MNLKKTTLAAGLAAALAAGMVGQANASVYASSSLDLQNFTVVIGGTTTNPINTFEFTTTNTATLNGVSSPTQSASCGGTLASNTCGGTPTLNAAVANAPGGSINRAENDYSFFGPGTNTYSNSDSVILTSELGSGGVDPSATRQIAESEVQATGDGRANAEITSNTGFTFTFTVSGTGSLTLSFEADPQLYAAINQLGFVSGSSQANLSAGFTLTQNSTGETVTWSPQGTLANDCSVGAIGGVTCVENNDTVDLNRNLATTSNGSTVQHSRTAGFSLFGISINGLTDGDWTLAFNALTSTSVRVATVPEPSALALLGIAMAGMGLASRRRKLM